MSVLYGLIVGFSIGLYGAFHKWSLFKTIVVSFIISAFIQFLVSPKVHAGYDPYTDLKDTTVHIAVGSGSIVQAPSGKHYLLTNWHVCIAGGWKGTISGSTETGTLYLGKVVKSSPEKDLCAAEIKKQGPALKLAKEFLPDSQLWTRGYPEGVLTQSQGKANIVTTWNFEFPIDMVGECPAEFRKHYDFTEILRGCIATYQSLLTDLYSRPGSSGSPVVNNKGQLVAVISSWHTERKYDAGCVQFEDVREFLADL